MKYAEIISVGTELLMGDIVNTDARFLSRELNALGFGVYHQTTVGDNAVRLKKALVNALTRSDIIVFSGGLGPTSDDITMDTISRALGMTLELHGPSLENIERFFERIGRPMEEANKKQAMLPANGVVFENTVGTAPGCALESDKQIIVMLPGPPAELEKMFELSVKPFLSQFSDQKIVSKTLKIYGIGESTLQTQLGHYFAGSNPTVSPYAKDGTVELRITASAQTANAAYSLIDPLAAKIKKELGDTVFSEDGSTLPEVVVGMLDKGGFKLATAESCTGGLISKMITDVPGASRVFDMGIAAYSNDTKTMALNVPTELIEKHGAVSAQVAAQMARGIRAISGADYGVAISGVAGPDGSEQKPVGLVYVALCDGPNVYIDKTMMGHGIINQRESIRARAALFALNMIRVYMTRGTLEGGHSAEDIENGGLIAPIAALSKRSRTDEFAGQVSFNAVEAPDGAMLKDDDIDEYSVNRIHVPEPEDTSPRDEDGYSAAGFVLGQDFVLPDESPLGSGKPTGMTAADLIRSELSSHSKTHEAAHELPDISAHVGEDSLIDPEDLFPEVEDKWYMRLLKYLVPWKGDSVTEIVRKSVFSVSLIAFLITGAYLLNFFIGSLLEQARDDKLRGMINYQDTSVAEDGSLNMFSALIAQNSDFIGWINIEGTNVDYPVVKSKDNDEYLHVDFWKSKSSRGAIFLDKNAILTAEERSKNLVIYGHSVTSGNMFSQIKKYDDIEFYKKHPVIEFNSRYRRDTYQIVSVFKTNTARSDDSGYLFPAWQSGFSSDEQFEAWVKGIKLRSIIDIPVDVKRDDELITLSTCAYDIKNVELRFIVVARRVMPGESSTVEVKKAKVNPNPMYPMVWYERKNKIRPDFPDDPRNQSFDTSSVQGVSVPALPLVSVAAPSAASSAAPSAASSKVSSAAPSAASSKVSSKASSGTSSAAPPAASSAVSSAAPSTVSSTAPPAASSVPPDPDPDPDPDPPETP